MVLEFSKSISHECGNIPKKNYSEDQLQDFMVEFMRKNGIDSSQMEIKENGKIEIHGEPRPILHTLMLQAEEWGLKTKYTKKTLIEISN